MNASILTRPLRSTGAICWSVQLLPQVYKSWKLKNTAGLSSYMLVIWVSTFPCRAACSGFATDTHASRTFFLAYQWAGGIFLGTYVVVKNINIPLIVQSVLVDSLASTRS